MSLAIAILLLIPAIDSNERGFQLIRQMAGALRSANSVELTAEYELLNPSRSFTGLVRATREPDRYWCQLNGSDGSVQYASLADLNLTFTDESGKRTTEKVSSITTVPNDASAVAVSAWQTFLDPNRFAILDAESCFFVHSEEVEGSMCDLVGTIKSENARELITSIRYYWIDQKTHLPRAFQLHGIIRGRSTTGPKWMLKNVALNPIWKPDALNYVPDQVAVAAGPEKSAISESKEWKVGDPCPDVQVETLDLKPVSLRQFLSGKTLLTFWAAWCGPCLAELNALKEMPEVQSGEIRVIAIGAFDSKGNLRKYAAEHLTSFRVLIDPDAERKVSRLAEAFGVAPIPHAFLFDSSKSLVDQWIGFSSKEELAKKLKAGGLNTP